MSVFEPNINQENTGSVVITQLANPNLQVNSKENDLLLTSGGTFDIQTYFLSSSYVEVFNNGEYVKSRNFNDVNKIEDPASNNLISTLILDPFQDTPPESEIDGVDNLSNSRITIVGYEFLDKKIGSELQNLFISEISPDRTELELNSFVLSYSDIVEQTSKFVEERDYSLYFLEFLLNFGEGKYVTGVNIKLGDDVENPKILVKLSSPLPDEFIINSPLWIVTKIDEPKYFSVEQTFPVESISDTLPIQGPNFNIEVKNQVNNSTLPLSFKDLTNTQLTSSQNQLDSLLEEKGLKINIDYTDFNNFVHFSSAQTRLENFYDKISLIESYSSSLNSLNNTTSGSYMSSSIGIFSSKISSLISKFDQYEYFLYYNTGSYSWPKDTSTLPYILAPTTSSKVIDWLGDGNINSPSYGGLLASASEFDSINRNQLLKSIPEYLRDDSENQPYELFVDMVAQHYDNIWIYLKDITNKYDNDNRLNFGVSKDLVADAIRDFGVKLYQNNFSNNDLFTAFLGLTPEGGLFPYPNMTGSLPTPSGFEYVDLLISASNDILPQEDVNKSLYKRIYHNLPYLLNSKGTIPGLRALITSYGIPDTILRINEYGGKDKINVNDWDHWQNEFNYAFHTSGSNFISSSWELDPAWNATANHPESLVFRFKTDGLPTTGSDHHSQSLWFGNGSDGTSVVLQYTGSGYTSGSYSGSIKDPYYQYANLIFYPDNSDTSTTASVYLPFFDGNWWSVMVRWDGASNWDLYSGNNLYEGGDNDTRIGFFESSSVNGNKTPWITTDTSYFPVSFSISAPWGYDIVTYDDTAIYDGTGAGSSSYSPFSGSYQEIRYYANGISESIFKDYVMNPYSIEGNSLNSSPDDLAFRAAIGGELYTSSISIHPKVTGSWTTTQSFATGSSNFYYDSTPHFVTNKEFFFVDQPVAGIKNVIGDKIRIEDNVFPGGYPTSSVLSPFESILQQTNVSQSYTPSINYLEVAFSPQNQINEDIMSQLGFFNIGDYIGDPRLRSSSADSYPALDDLRNEYFQKYIKNYDLTDFIRLIKFFDNSLFKMIKDFVPARTSLASGLVIKQHLLERNKYPQPQVDINTPIAKHPTGSSTNNLIFYQKNIAVSGTVKPQWNDYNEGTIENTIGGTGGTFQMFNSLSSSISGSTGVGPDNRFHLTQSWSESIMTISGSIIKIHNSQDEFYNGEFSGSNLTVTTQSLFTPYSKVLKEFCFTPIQYFQTSSAEKDDNIFYYNALLDQTKPDNGEAYFLSFNPPSDGTWTGLFNFPQQEYIKISHFDTNGEDIEIPLQQVTKIRLFNQYFTDANGYPFYFDYDLIGNTNKGSYQSLKIQPTTLQLMNPGSPYLSGWHPDNVENYYVTASITNLSIATDSGDFKLSSYTTVGSASNYRGYSFDSGELNFGNTPNTQIQFSSSFFISSSGGNGQNYPITLFRERNSIKDFVVRTGYDSAAITTGSFYVETTAIQGDKYYIEIVTDNTSATLKIDELNFSVTQSRPVTSSACLSTILEPYVTVNNYYNSDFNPLMNNAESPRLNTFYQDVDYSTGIFTPVNFAQLISGSAVKFPIADSHYTQKSSIIPRYEGAKSTSQTINRWSPPDTIQGYEDKGTFGKSPTVESLQAAVVYADWIGGYPPEHMNASGIHVQYIINQDGTISIPNTSENSLAILQQNFVSYNIIDVHSSTVGTGITPQRTILRGGYKITPIMYTQSGSTANSGGVNWAPFIKFNGELPNETNYTLEQIALSTLNQSSSNVPGLGQHIDTIERVIGAVGNTSSLAATNNNGWNVWYETPGAGALRTGSGDCTYYGGYLALNANTYNFSINANLDAQFEIVNPTTQDNKVEINLNRLTISPGQNLPLNFQSSSITLMDSKQFNVGKGKSKICNYNYILNGTEEIDQYINSNLNFYYYSIKAINNTSSLDTNQLYLGSNETYWNYYLTPLPNSFNSESVATGSIWSYPTSSTYSQASSSQQGIIFCPVTSSALNIGYNISMSQADITGSGFNAIEEKAWDVRIGDEFRFEGVENAAYMVTKVLPPHYSSSFEGKVSTVGHLEVHFGEPLPSSSINLDHFLIRRYIPAADQILMEGFKPGGSVGPYIIKPEYVTDNLNKGIDDIITNLTDKGLI